MSIYFEIHAGHHQMLKMNEGKGVQDSYHHDTFLAEEETLDGNENAMIFLKLT